METRAVDRPNFDRLFERAASQEGLFTLQQAADAGYSPQLMAHHLRRRRFVRVRRGIYRLVHFPLGERDELIIAWLWSEQTGVVSHQTALSIHELSDLLPAQIHLTLPWEWRKRRFRVPKGLVLHYSDVPQADRTWFGAVPVTTPRRTLCDCAQDALSPEILRQAAQQALARGLVTDTELAEVEEALRAFGGLKA